MATITQLSDDVIAIILENGSLEDIMNFKSTCKRFQQITLFQKFWEKKYYENCPTAEKKYNREKQKKIFHHINFKERIEVGLYCIQKLQYYAFVMSENRLCDTDKKQLERLLRSTAENSITYYFVWDEINRISAQKSCILFSNLTREYNFKLIFYYLKQYRFIYKQMKFMKMPKIKLLLEKQLTIVAQYFQPHVSYSAVKTWLDGIAQTVLSRLKNKYPAHSICSTTLEQFSFWRDNNIDDNFWNEIESRQIMWILEKYIFSELKIYKWHQLLITSDLKANCIKYNAECFRRHLLTVTYHIVARRLGICSILGIKETDIAITWKPKYNTNIWYNAEYFHMSQNYNLFYPSNIIRSRQENDEFLLLKNSLNEKFDFSITQQIMFNFYLVLIRYHNICYDSNFGIFKTLLVRHFRKHVKDINIEIEYKNITNTIKVKFNGMKNPLKRRTKKVKFAVGMIVTHSWKGCSFPYSHDGVIIGWHRECDRTFQTTLEQTNMCPYLQKCYGHDHNHVCTCQQYSANAHQLHYIILTENNSICYVQQNQLSIRPPRKIDNIEIGRYFSSFEGTYYVPNESLRKHYPKDTAEIAKILAQQ